MHCHPHTPSPHFTVYVALAGSQSKKLPQFQAKPEHSAAALKALLRPSHLASDRLLQSPCFSLLLEPGKSLPASLTLKIPPASKAYLLAPFPLLLV